MNLIRSKKAQGFNYVAVIIVIIIFAFFSMLAYTIWSMLMVELIASGQMTPEALILGNNFTRAFASADYLIILLMVILWIGIGLTSFKLATRNAFAIITIIFGIFWGLIAYFFNFIFIQLVSPSIFSATIGVFPRTMIICTNLHYVMLINIIIGTLTLYGKKEKGQFLS